MLDTWSGEDGIEIVIDEDGEIHGWCATLVALGLMDRKNCPVRGVSCAECMCG